MSAGSINLGNVPRALREVAQWVVWKIVERDGKPTKVPFNWLGEPAKSNDPETWCDFKAAAGAAGDGYDGIGFVFTSDDPFCGVDLDGCRDPLTGKVAEWAREIILKADTYAEVSPSRTGVKLFCVGGSPFDGGRKKLLDAPPVGDKAAAIEIYDQGRYFAVTGLRLAGPAEPQERQEFLDGLKAAHWPDEPAPAVRRADFRSDEAVFERARRYLAKLPPAVSGQNGHSTTFHAACVLVLGFELPHAEALELMHEFNQRCQPPWGERDLERKVREAAKQPGKRGYLRNAAPANWQRIPVPQYNAALPSSPEPPEPRRTTLAAAAGKYLESLRSGGDKLYPLCVPDLDYALFGGVAPGELVIFGARPSHGKSAAALQCVHQWTGMGLPCVIVSEEMSAMMLGKRTLQFLSHVPQEHWYEKSANLQLDLEQYGQTHAECVVAEGCGTTDAACRAIEDAVKNHGAKCAVIDYAQLLRSPGKGRYEQVTNTSIMLRELANQLGIVLLALCQLNREVEHRGKFVPLLSDLKETGQLEQDADVTVLLAWPYRQDTTQPADKYQFFVAKCRNRGVRRPVVTCRFVPDRQMIVDATEAERAAYESEESASPVRF